MRGLVKVKTEADDFKALLEKHPVTISGRAYSCKVTGANTSPYIISIAGIVDRTAAEALKGQKLYIAAPIEQENDAFRVSDLVGLTVLEHGHPIGTVARLCNFGAGEIVEITTTDGKEEMFAFTKRNFPEVDCKEGWVKIVRPQEI